jgi:hypothetical protein
MLGQIVPAMPLEHPGRIPVHHRGLVMHGRRPIVGSHLPIFMLLMPCLAHLTSLTRSPASAIPSARPAATALLAGQHERQQDGSPDRTARSAVSA